MSRPTYPQERPACTPWFAAPPESVRLERVHGARRRDGRCVRCGHVLGQCRRDMTVPWFRRPMARGLCGGCYADCTRSGTLSEWPRLTRSAAELLEDAELLRRRFDPPMTWDAIAHQLGVAPATLDRARVRARARTAGPSGTGRSGPPAPPRSSR